MPATKAIRIITNPEAPLHLSHPILIASPATESGSSGGARAWQPRVPVRRRAPAAGGVGPGEPAGGGAAGRRRRRGSRTGARGASNGPGRNRSRSRGLPAAAASRPQSPCCRRRGAEPLTSHVRSLRQIRVRASGHFFFYSYRHRALFVRGAVLFLGRDENIGIGRENILIIFVFKLLFGNKI